MTGKACFDRRSVTRSMVKGGILFLLLVLLPVRGQAQEVGDKAPGFRGVTVQGKELSYDRDFRGKKPVYLIFWTTWCPHCKEEFPLVEDLYERYGSSVEFIGINLGIKKDLAQFVKNKKIPFPVVYDAGNKIADSFHAQVQTNIVIDKSGTIIFKSRDFQEEIGRLLKKLKEEEKGIER
ncbi:MAG: TlpA disulfide reductase family protein [Nitrospiraceae bacterium]|nr:TlpA disulfide reductase family protein [Nitrospiraceae bacterium]